LPEGDPFYVNKKNANTLRLNFSSVDKETIWIGIKRLGELCSRQWSDRISDERSDRGNQEAMVHHICSGISAFSYVA
jgi:hypothetical protein